MTSLSTGSCTLVGQVRSANEDSFLVTEDLVAVADGMGGHRAGEVASADTVEVLRRAAGSRSVQDLVAAVHRANRQINDRAAEDAALRGMGTTVCVVGLVRYDDAEQVAVLNVGDSRVYLMADGILTRLTEDHSLVETLVREGRISPEEAERHPQRNVITRALGVEALVVVDAWLLRPADGDRLLLCSDGLFGELSEARIAEVLTEAPDPETAARQLAQEADAAGGRDNVTTVVVDVVDSGQEAAPLDGRYRRISTPAVDLSDIDDDRDRTDTVLAVVVPPDPNTVDPNAVDADGSDTDHAVDPDDLAGVGTPDGELVDDPDEPDDAPAKDPWAAPVPTAGSESEEASADAGSDVDGAPRWRTALFVVAIVVVVAVMAGALFVYSQSGWVVAASDGVEVLKQGPRDTILFIGPKEVERFDDLPVGTLTDADRRQVERGRTFSSRAEAQVYIDGIEGRTTTTTTTTTTTMPQTTTTEVAPGAEVPATPVDPNATVPTAVSPAPAGP